MKILLDQFNKRETAAFGEVYAMFYNELFHFTSKLYKETEVAASDIIHDIFIHLWQNSKQQFNDLVNIKAYIYVSIRNGFRNYLTHKKCIERHKHTALLNNERFILQVAESELFSILEEAMDLLPKDCAQVLRYYLEGWDIKEISIKTGKPERTVYNKKNEAIAILKTKFPKNRLLFFL